MIGGLKEKTAHIHPLRWDMGTLSRTLILSGGLKVAVQTGKDTMDTLSRGADGGARGPEEG